MGHVIVVGAGAIGSHLLPHLARSPRVSRVTVIDRDRYVAGNIRGQHIDLRDSGRPKAAVQARRLRRINPRLPVVPILAAVEDSPLGTLRGSVILAALDSRKARMVVNQAAWRLGVPWIDAGVHPDGMLARVRVFVPTEDGPCLECSWDQTDYDALEHTYPCAPDSSAGATNAPSALGALAASLQAIECDKLLAGDMSNVLIGRDVLADARHHVFSVTAYRRNPSCRMPDHAGWRIDALSGPCARTTIADVLALGSTLRGATESLAMGVAGRRMATELRCMACGASHATCALDRHVRTSGLRCSCGGRLGLLGFGLHDLVLVDRLPAEARDRTLSDIGVRPRDVLTLRTSQVEAHFELGAGE